MKEFIEGFCEVYKRVFDGVNLYTLGVLFAIASIMLSIILFILLVVGGAEASEFWKDKDGNLTREFSVCDCVNEGRNLYPHYRDDQIEVMCVEAYKVYLLEESEKSGEVIVKSYVSCKEV
jgi:hypothetical protein